MEDLLKNEKIKKHLRIYINSLIHAKIINIFYKYFLSNDATSSQTYSYSKI